MTSWVALWLIYAAIGTALELYCVVTRNGQTISEQAWRFEGIHGFVVTHTSLRRMALVAGLAVLSVHLLTGYI